MKSWLHNNDIEIHSTHTERKFALTERFIKTLKNEIYKHMTAVSENVNIDKLYTAVDKCNNRYHRTIKMKPTDVKTSKYMVLLTSMLKIMINILNLKLLIM